MFILVTESLQTENISLYQVWSGFELKPGERPESKVLGGSAILSTASGRRELEWGYLKIYSVKSRQIIYLDF